MAHAPPADPERMFSSHVQTFGFCTAQGIFIAPHLAGCTTRNRGSGVYATQKILEGQKLMHVPTKALYTTASIPDEFANSKARKGVPVHALLAAFLTFGLKDSDDDRFRPWMSMWPELSDFTTSMPMFWPDRCRPSQPTRNLWNGADRVVSEESGQPSFDILPPPTTGSWLPLNTEDAPMPGGSTSLANQQLTKLTSHLDSIARLLPEHSSSLHDPHDPAYWHFVHNWCSVNTRCFYYVIPGEKRPGDPNEAMAMCPGMDLFNHTDGDGCATKYDRSGYYVNAGKDYNAGEEIFLSYGAHTNDVLWAEYGFLLDENEFDAIRIDKLVLGDVDEGEMDMLAEYGFLGEYWLKSEGVCWRTEVVAWLKVLTKEDWLKMVQDGWDPTEQHQVSTQVKRKVGGAELAVRRETRTKKAKRKIVQWMLNAKAEVEVSLRGLRDMSEEDLVDTFADDAGTMRAQGVPDIEAEAARKKQASQRKGMCLQRWRQIWEMCMETLRLTERDCEGSFVTMEPGRTKEDLGRSIEEVLRLGGRKV